MTDKKPVFPDPASVLRDQIIDILNGSQFLQSEKVAALAGATGMAIGAYADPNGFPESLELAIRDVSSTIAEVSRLYALNERPMKGNA